VAANPEAARSADQIDTRVPRLSLAERDRRWQAIRAQMDKRGLDCLAAVVLGSGDMGNIGYLSSVYLRGAGGALVVFPRRGEVSVHMGGNLANLQMWRRSQDWVTDIIPAPQPISFSQITVGRLSELGLEKGRVGVVGSGGPMVPEGGPTRIFIERGEHLLPEAVWEDATDLVETARLIKSEEEVTFVQKAAEIGDLAIEATAHYAKAGMRSRAVYARLISAMVENGSDIPFILWDAGPSPVHGVWIPDDNILRPGHVIVTEYSAYYRGYEAQFQRPMAVGHVPDLYARLFDAAVASYQKGLETLKPGNTFADVTNAMSEPVKAAGFITITPYYHGLSPQFPISFSQARRSLYPSESLPRWQEFQDRMGSLPVEPGMVIAFEPNAVTADQRSGVHVGDPILVTESGNRRLSRLPLEWFIV